MQPRQTSSQTTKTPKSAAIAERKWTTALTVNLSALVIATSAHSQTTAPAATLPEPAPSALTAVNAPVNTAALLPSAVATPILQSKDWLVSDLGTSCVASTTSPVAGVAHRLEVEVDKSGVKPVTVSIRSDVLSPNRIGFEAGKEHFLKISGATDVYWNAPRNTENLIAQFKRDMKFDATTVETAGVGIKVPFSLRGSSAALDALSKKCAQGAALPTNADDDFEKAFLPQTASSVDIRKHTPATADRLKALYEQALSASRASGSTALEIQALNNKYANLIKELGGLRSNIDRLSQQDLARLQADQASTQAAIDQANTDLTSLRPQRQSRETELVQANADYEAAYNALSPYIAENNRLVSVVRSEEARLSQANQSQTEAQNRLSNAEEDVRDLNNELMNIRNRIPSAQSDVRNAQFDYDQAANETRRFDARAEIQRRQMSDSRISRINQEIEALHQRISVADDRVRQREQERVAAANALQTCKQTAGADCSQQVSALEQARQRQATEIQQRDSLRNLEMSKVRERDQVLHDIAREVNDHLAVLQQRESQARMRLSDAQSRLSDLENRSRQISQIEIPRKQNEVAVAQNDLARADQAAASARAGVQTARSELNRFRTRVGYDQLEATANQRLQRVNSLKSEMAKLDREIKKRDTTIADGQKRLAKISADIQATLETIRLKQGRSAEVEKLLEPYDQEKNALMAKKAVSDQALETARVEYSQTI